MACLKVPFEGNSIQELYKKINKGIIAKIPMKYSQDVTSIIKLCLTKDQRRRPTVSELLEHPTVLKKMEEYGIRIERRDELPGEVLGEMMGTIKLPKNLNLLIQQLPKSKYNSHRALSAGNKRDSLPQNAFKKKPEL